MVFKKCRKQTEDNTLFRPNGSERTVNTGNRTKKQLKINFKKFSLRQAIVAGTVLLVILFVSLNGGGGYKTTLRNYYKAHEKNDADLMYKSVIAQYWIDYYNEAWENALDRIQGDIKGRIDGWNCGDDIKITYKIQNERRATKEQLEELEENIYDWYAHQVYDRDDFSIKDAYVLDIDITVKGDDGTKRFHYPDGFLLVKEKGKWKISEGSISCSFYDNQYG